MVELYRIPPICLLHLHVRGGARLYLKKGRKLNLNLPTGSKLGFPLPRWLALLVGRVREVDAHDTHAGVDAALERAGLLRGRADGGRDLRHVEGRGGGLHPRRQGSHGARMRRQRHGELAKFGEHVGLLVKAGES